MGEVAPCPKTHSGPAVVVVQSGLTEGHIQVFKIRGTAKGEEACLLLAPAVVHLEAQALALVPHRVPALVAYLERVVPEAGTVMEAEPVPLRG
jgi:hypothetical protein